jgi:hypothetical protein
MKSETITEYEYVLDHRNKPVKVLEVYESFTGWYWFITEVDKEDPNYLYGKVYGFETEWGEIWRPELESMPNKIWKVPKENWHSTGRVVNKEGKQ